MKKTILLIILIVLGACNKANENPKDLALNKSKLLPKANSAEPVRKISTDEAKRLAEKQFQKYLPKILDSHNAYLDSQDTFTGDFTGDGTDDVLIYFSLAPKEGGNTIVGQGLVLYKNTGTNIKVIGGYEPDYLFNFKKINSGKIYVEKLEYAETDGRCCPSIRTEHQLTISGTKIY
ncbi:hypothetical protein IX39_07610 [Chryseobacterium formosense]|uniref:Lipoprotein n=1 Tax=Chryseobacterium formosense TaxID=236814 RepID=A0A085Z7T9_9FLAO|nr:integrin alpha [Chryseobacterium formosense]KFF00503.1 hypothetical protein IX39_07610 [Chryseobacterium formosense]SFT34439.1 hypothetical protein SAMN05421857_0223 [Chryseobacterium formosense]